MGRKLAVTLDLEFIDTDDAIEEMLSSESAFVLDVLVPYQEHVLPMIPSGHSVKDIIRE